MGGNQPGTQSTRSHSKSDRIRILGSGNVWGEVIRVGGVLTSGQLCALHHAAASFCQDFADTSKQPGFCRCKQATNPSLSFYRSGHFWASRPIIVTAQPHHKVGRACVSHHIHVRQCAQHDKPDTPKSSNADMLNTTHDVRSRLVVGLSVQG